MIKSNSRILGQREARKKVAVIGTGLAGLHAAHLLSQSTALQDQFEVHLFERNDQLGLDGSSISIDNVRIDVPLRSFNAGYYPTLMQLYREIGVSIHQANYTFSFATLTQLQSPFFLYNGHSGFRGISLPSQPLIRSSLLGLLNYGRLIITFIFSYLCLLGFALYHSTFGHLQDPNHTLSSEPLQNWLSRHSRMINPTFVDAVLIPLFSAMTTSSTGQVLQIPTAEILFYISATFLQSHFTVSEGVVQAQTRLVANIPLQNIHLGTMIHNVKANTSLKGNKRKASLVATDTKTQTSIQYDDFDDVIFATPANLSASLLDNYRDSLSQLTSNKASLQEEVDRIQKLQNQLRKVQYETSTVINHTDSSLLPRSRADWRDLNIVLSGSSPAAGATEEAGYTRHKSKGANHTMATHVCHRMEDGRFVFQTTNPTFLPSSHCVLSNSTFSRALTLGKGPLQGLFEWRRKKEKNRLGDWEMILGPLQRTENSQSELPSLWFCGSYSHGIPLLEGCVTSSRLVVAEILRQDQTKIL